MSEKTHMWIWRGVAKSALVDPARPPANAEEHQRRIKDSLWGVAFARPHPVKFLAEKDGFAIVHETGEKKPVKVQRSILLPWKEGLLVVAEIKRTLKDQAGVKWLEPLLHLLKANANDLPTSASYVENMFETAITGPKFICSDGATVAHRRNGMSTEPLPEDSAEDPSLEDWYSVKDLLEYLPAWEAFLHPNCGLYQDYYLVSWGKPYESISYAGTECGHDTPGCTWEPDECLPMDLDPLRVSAKRRYVEEKQRRYAEEKQKAKNATAPQENEAVVDLPQKKKARIYNPSDLPDAQLFEDVWDSSIRHGFSKRLENEGEEFIKKGWPLFMEDYPKGYGPADPPGFCTAQCTCMEDWHIGKISTQKPGIDTQERLSEAQKALASFIPESAAPQAASHPHVRRRGTVTQKCYLEATSEAKLRKPNPSLHDERRLAASFSSSALSVMREAAQNLPLKALTQPNPLDGEGLLRAFAPAFQAIPLDWAAYQFVVSEGPAWLRVSPSGACSMDARAMPPMAGSPPAKLHVILKNFCARDDQMACHIDIGLPAGGGPNIERLTKRLMENMMDLEAKVSFPTLSAELSEIYDFNRKECKKVSLERWAQVVSKAALLSRAFAVSHLDKHDA